MTAPSGTPIAVPELGPSLGRLTAPPDVRPRGPLGVTLDDLRLELTTRLFELAGASRQFAEAGDREGALQSLGRVAWLGLWEQAVTAAAARVTEAVNAHLRAAGAESRLPAKRLERLLLTPEETSAIAARFSGAAAELVVALDMLERAAASAAGGDRAPARWMAWQDALNAAARRLVAAWLALEAAAEAEQVHWQAEVMRVRAWRRPRWPLWLITFLVLAAVTYIGLLLGGRLPVPVWLRGAVDRWGWGSGRWS